MKPKFIKITGILTLFAVLTVSTSAFAGPRVKLRNGSVTTSKIRNGAVTNPKIRTFAVSNSKIANGAVTESKISSDIATWENVSGDAVRSTGDIEVSNGKITSYANLPENFASIGAANGNPGLELVNRITGDHRIDFFLDGNGSCQVLYSGTGAAGVSGVAMGPGAMAWSSTSDRNAKKNFTPADTAEILEKLAAIPITRWRAIEKMLGNGGTKLVSLETVGAGQ